MPKAVKDNMPVLLPVRPVGIPPVPNQTHSEGNPKVRADALAKTFMDKLRPEAILLEVNEMDPLVVRTLVLFPAKFNKTLPVPQLEVMLDCRTINEPLKLAAQDEVNVKEDETVLDPDMAKEADMPVKENEADMEEDAHEPVPRSEPVKPPRLNVLPVIYRSSRICVSTRIAIK